MTTIKSSASIEEIYLSKDTLFLQYPHMKTAIDKAIKGEDITDEVKTKKFFDKKVFQAGCCGILALFFSRIADFIRSIGHKIRMGCSKVYAAQFKEKAKLIAQLASIPERDHPKEKRLDKVQTTPEQATVEPLPEVTDASLETPEPPTPAEPKPQPLPEPTPPPVLPLEVVQEKALVIEEIKKQILDGEVSQQDEQNAAKLTDTIAELEGKQARLELKKSLAVGKLGGLKTQLQTLETQKKECEEQLDAKIKCHQENLLKLADNEDAEANALKILTKATGAFQAILNKPDFKEKSQQLIEKNGELQTASKALAEKQEEGKNLSKLVASLSEEKSVLSDDVAKVSIQVADAVKDQEQISALLATINHQSEELAKLLVVEKEALKACKAKIVEVPVPVEKVVPPPPPPKPEPKAVPTPEPVVVTIKPQVPKPSKLDEICKALQAEAHPQVAKLLEAALSKFKDQIVDWEKLEGGKYKLKLSKDCFMTTTEPASLMTFEKTIEMTISKKDIQLDGVFSYSKPKFMSWLTAKVIKISYNDKKKHFIMRGQGELLQKVVEGNKDVPHELLNCWQNGKAITKDEMIQYKQENK